MNINEHKDTQVFTINQNSDGRSCGCYEDHAGRVESNSPYSQFILHPGLNQSHLQTAGEIGHNSKSYAESYLVASHWLCTQSATVIIMNE